jgi:hypothetical protein
MIDIENKVLSVVREAVLAQYPTASVCGEYVEVPASFPCVTVTEDTNYTYVYTKDEQLSEHHCEVQYAVNVYSDRQTGAKLEAKAIMNIADNAMQGMKFWRTMTRQVPNVDRTIYRLIARYRAVVGEPTQVGDDLVFQMYQK